MIVTADRDGLRKQLDSQYSLSQEQVQFFRENGFIKLKQVLSPEVLAYYGREIAGKVIELNTMHLPMNQRTTYQKAFLQVTNIWRKSDIVKEFVFGKRLARLAAELMGVRGVRLYHDQALYKEKSGGVTPWHADQFYWPLSGPNTCTVWIPLQQTPREMGPLAFAAKSQQFTFGRDLEISDASEKLIAEKMREAGFAYVEEPFDLGEVSYHYGWTFHRAGANTTDRAREVMTVIYMDQDMRLARPANPMQESDWKEWMPGARIGELIDTSLNPVLYSRELRPT